MAYNSNKGNQHMGDVQYEGDPNDVQIDFENDFVAIKTNGSQRLIVSGSAITASVDVSGSGALMVGGKLTAGNSKLTFDATTLVLTGALQQTNGKVRFILPEESDAFVIMSPDETSTQYRYDANGVDHYFNAPTRFGANTGAPTHTVSVTGHVSASIGVTSSGFHTLTTVIDGTHVSSSLNISGSKFYGDGSTLSGLPSDPAITALNNAGANRIITSDGGTAASAEPNLTFNGSTLAATGHISASLGVSGSSLHVGRGLGTTGTVIDSTHVSSSLNISGSKFYGAGVFIAGNMSASLGVSGSSLHIGRGLGTTGTVIDSTHVSSSLNISGAAFFANGVELLRPAIEVYDDSGNNRIITSIDSVAVKGEPNLTFDGSRLSVTGQVSASLGVTGSDLALISNTPKVFYSSSAGTPLGFVGYNTSDNLVLQNDVNNKHIVFKANDNGVTREGLRLNGAVPEVVINESAESLINFRVESATNTHMLYVTGSGKVGIGTSSPSHTLEATGSFLISGSTHSSYTMRSTGGGYAVASSDNVVIFNNSGAQNATLPQITLSNHGVQYYIKNIGSGTVTLTGSSGFEQFIDGQQTLALEQGDAAKVMGVALGSGFEWAVLSYYDKFA